MKLFILFLVLLMCAGTQAVAGQTPRPGYNDARMRTVVYNPNQVVRLSAAVGRAIVVTFSPDENVSTVAVSNSRDLTADPRGSFLFMKPKTLLPPQPIIVLTNGPRGQRRYVFELEATPSTIVDDAKKEAYYSVEFRYPQDREEARMAAELQRLAHQEQLSILSELAQSNTKDESAPRKPKKVFKNWRYVGRGDEAILPVEVHDDGESTMFRFHGNMRMPAIFRINPDGKEATVDYAVKGDTVIVGAVAPGWRLRDGDTVLCIWNRAFDKVGRSHGTHTTSPNVKRLTKDASL